MTTATLTLEQFLDALASKQSTPGGGGASAVTGSQAAALLSMVVNFTLGNQKYAAVRDEMQGYLQQTEALRRDLLNLADQDSEAFNAVAACYSMPRETDSQKDARTKAMQEALKGAAAVPYQTAEKCLAVLRLVEPIGAKGNRNVVSDAACALSLAWAALECALVNVNINLKFIKDDEFVNEWSRRRDSVLASARGAHQAGKIACEQALGVAL